MILLAAALAGALAARVLWVGLRPVLHQPLFLRDNFRGRTLPTATGLVLPLALLVVEAVRAVADATDVVEVGRHGAARLSVLVAGVGLGLLGLVDDLADTGEARGFRGHLGELARGRLSTGGLKLLGGMAVALVAVAPHADGSAVRLLVDAGLVALGANLGNLFDRRPGRTLKAGVLSCLVLAVGAGGPSVLAPVAVVAGAGLAMFADDARERLMLGDAGANVLGGVAALGVVLACSPLTRALTLVMVAVLNGLSEVVSFSRVIDGVRPLRAVDRWGRRP